MSGISSVVTFGTGVILAASSYHILNEISKRKHIHKPLYTVKKYDTYSPDTSRNLEINRYSVNQPTFEQISHACQQSLYPYHNTKKAVDNSLQDYLQHNTITEGNVFIETIDDCWQADIKIKSANQDDYLVFSVRTK